MMPAAYGSVPPPVFKMFTAGQYILSYFSPLVQTGAGPFRRPGGIGQAEQVPRPPVILNGGKDLFLPHPLTIPAESV